MRFGHVRHWAVLAGFLFASPSFAFDDLLRSLGAIALTPQAEYVFDYTAPAAGFVGPEAPRMGSSNFALAQALAAGGVDGFTGIDFDKVTGVLIVGDAPKTLTFVFGEAGFADGSPAALLARNFEQNAVEGVTVFAMGEDYAVDIANARLPDPFANGLGQSQRLALGDQYVLRTAGWPEMNATLAALPAPSTERQIWSAMVEGLRAASGENAHLTQASGWTGNAFLDSGPNLELLLDPEAAKTKIKASAPEGSPILFPFALFAVTENASAAAVQIALPFDDSGLAEAAADEIAERLVLHPFTPSKPRITVERIEPFSIAVVSIDLPPAEANELFARWIGDIYNRSFEPLMIRF